ncbi:hypothetical protein NBRC116587_25080 [Pseudoteredinibacter isoporae]
MEGVVLHFDSESAEGIIRTDEGERFAFQQSDWKSDGPVSANSRVDFVVKNDKASEIYLLKTTANSLSAEELVQKMKTMQASSTGQRLTALFSEGIHNTIGFAASVVLFITCFLTIMTVSQFTLAISLWDIGPDTIWGKLIAVCSLITAICYYGGASRIYTRIFGLLTVALICYRYIEFLNHIAALRKNLNIGINLTGRGTYRTLQTDWQDVVVASNLMALLVLLFASFKKGYKGNEKTF